MKIPDEELELRKKLNPDFPDWARPKTRKKKTPAGELRTLIYLFLKTEGIVLNSNQSTGLYDPRTKRYRRSGQARGHSDTWFLLNGKYVACELKVGKDKLSEYQLRRKAEIEAAGGIWLTIKTFEQFKTEYLKLKQ